MALNEDRLWALLDDLGVELDVREHADALDPVVDGIADEVPRARLDRVVELAASQVWDAELRNEMAELLGAYREELERRLRTIEEAERELDVPGRANLVARALVHRAATDAILSTSQAYARLRRLEERLAVAPAGERRSIALEAAVEVAGSVDIPDDELDQALAGLEASLGAGVHVLDAEAAHWLARSLATPGRRADARAGLADLVEAFAPGELPLLQAELLALLAAEQPEDAAADGAWLSLVVGLAELELGLVADGPSSGLAASLAVRG